MGLMDALRGGLVERMDEPEPEDQLREQLRAEQDTALLLTERLTELELALEDQGWQKLGGEGDFEFSRDALRKISRLARLMWLKNPLIRRGVNVRAYYTWAEPPDITATDDAVQRVLDESFADDANAAEWWGHVARLETDVDSHVDGNVFLALFTDPDTGFVSLRTIPFDEIVQIVNDPDDRTRPRWYLRAYRVEQLDARDGTIKSETRKSWHPHHTYRPARGRPERIGDVPVKWDAPILHHRAGGLKRMRYGVPEVYAAMDWARAHKGFLEDTSTLIRSLARLAWKATGKRSGKAATALASKLSLDTGESNPPAPAGSAIGVPEGTDVTPISKSGATIGAADSRYLRLQVAAALDLPDTWLSGDADQGNRATAETLDRPTELMLESRRQRWTKVDLELIDYLMRAQVRARSGILSGTTRIDAYDRERLDVQWDRHVEHGWSPLVEHSTRDRVEAIVMAATLSGRSDAGTIPFEALARELLTTLGFDDVDELVDEVVAAAEEDEDDPPAPPGVDPDDPDAPPPTFGESLRRLSETIERLAAA